MQANLKATDCGERSSLWRTRWLRGAAFALMAFAVPAGTAEAQTATADRLQALEQQLQVLTDQIQALQEELEQTRAETERAAKAAEDATDQANEVREAQEQATVDGKPIVTSGNPNIRLGISGQINRAMNVANDGDDTKVYFVDNDVSNSRFRLVGSGDLGDGTTVGARIEVAVSPNNSSDVSQNNEDAGDSFDERLVEAFARNDSYGRLAFGKIKSATDDTSEYDLSLVAGPIMYSGVSDIVGGLQFTDGKSLTGITVGDAFYNFDGLGRKDGIRYDSPLFGPGLQISGGAYSDQRYDAAITWGGDYGDWSGVEFGDFLTLAAVGISDPNASGVDFRLDGSFSLLHMPTGLGLTLSSGREQADGKDPYNMYGKVSWDTRIFDIGDTGFGVDYTYGENVCGGDCSDGQSVGFAAVQLVEDFGIELYSQVRWFSLNTRGAAPNTDDIWVGTVGTRIKF